MLRNTSLVVANAARWACGPRLLNLFGAISVPKATACSSGPVPQNPPCCPPASPCEPPSIGISGFGRIGKCLFLLADSKGINVAAINQPFANAEMIAHALKYDTVHGHFAGKVCAKDDYLCVNGKCVRLFHEEKPEKIPWKDTPVKYVIDSSGKFTNLESVSKHLAGGAKKVILSAPSNDVPMFVKGVNFDAYKCTMNVASNASCTTNCAAPLIHAIHKKFGVLGCLMTTTHAVTSTQHVHDRLIHRSAFGNIVASTTGAAKAVAIVIPDLKGKVDGDATRVPTLDVSLLKLYINLKDAATEETIINEIKQQAACAMKGVITYVEDPKYVSSDFLGSQYSAIVDLSQTRVIDKFVTISAWYDNEIGYASRVLDLVKHMIETNNR